MILMGFDFFRIKHKHETLERIQTLTDAIAGTFLKIDGIEDKDYQQIIHLLSEEHSVYRTDTNRKYSDMIDYYTVWAHQIKTPIASMSLHLQNEDSVLIRKFTADLHCIEQYVEKVLTFLRLNSNC